MPSVWYSHQYQEFGADIDPPRIGRDERVRVRVVVVGRGAMFAGKMLPELVRISVQTLLFPAPGSGFLVI